jgi:uncharacterized SAM-binding protein YcdF (DUF218 family)
MSVKRRDLNAIMSYLFRAAVGVHLGCPYVLIFVLPYTFIGLQHLVVAIVLTILMVAIAVLFVADMVTRKREGRVYSKLVDAGIGSAWIAVVGFLLLNNLRSGIW